MAQKGGDFKNWSGLPWPENLQRTEEITSLMTFVFWQAQVAILNSARREERSLNRDMFQERHANFLHVDRQHGPPSTIKGDFKKRLMVLLA